MALTTGEPLPSPERRSDPPPLDERSSVVVGGGSIRFGRHPGGSRERVRDVRARAWERWQAAAGPWRGWAACHVLAAPEIDGVEAIASPVPPSAGPLTEQACHLLQRGGTAILLDLEPILGITIAAHINATRLAHAVLVLPRWAYSEAVLPVNTLLWTLVDTSGALSNHIEMTNVVFVLDAERNQQVVRPKRDPRADNRYALSAGDLPNLARLQERGIARVVKITRT